MQWYKQKGTKIECLLCAHACSIAKGGVGICGVNKNIGKKLECLVYGYPSAINIDPVEKKPLFHFLPGSKTFSLGTVGCNFRCPFCQNWQLSQSHNIETKRFVSPKEVVDSAEFHGCESIAFTYNEPTIFYPYAKDVATLAKKRGLKTIFVSNGFMSDWLLGDMQGVIDAFNIDIKSFDPNYYKKTLKGGLEQVLHNVVKLKQNGHWIEITTLIIPNHNDSEGELSQIAHFIAKELGKHTPWHLSAFHPDFKELDTKCTPLQTLQKAQTIAQDAGLKHIYLGNIAKDTKTKCTQCGKTLLKREGFVLTKNALQNSRCPKCQTKLAGVFQ